MGLYAVCLEYVCAGNIKDFITYTCLSRGIWQLIKHIYSSCPGASNQAAFSHKLESAYVKVMKITRKCIQPVHTLGRAHHLLRTGSQNPLPKHLSIDPRFFHSQKPIRNESYNKLFRIIHRRLFNISRSDSCLPSRDRGDVMNFPKSFYHALIVEIILFSHR